MNILIIGLGSIAKKHLIAINKVYSNSVVFALRSNRKAKPFGQVVNVFNLEEINKKIDFVIISNPTYKHFKTIENVLKLNCPLFIEKPPFDSLINIDELLNKISQKAIITYIACNLRFHPAIQFLKEYLDKNQKRINEVNIYYGSYLPDWRPNRNFRTIYSANKEMGGGVHLDLFHELDYSYWLFGKPASVRKILRSNSSIDISAIDYANYNLIYKQYVVNIILNYYRKDTKRTIEIIFEDKTWMVDLINCFIVDNEGNEIFSENYEPIDTYINQMRYFINNIQSNQKTINSIKESIEVLKICLDNEKT